MKTKLTESRGRGQERGDGGPEWTVEKQLRGRGRGGGGEEVMEQKPIKLRSWGQDEKKINTPTNTAGLD